MMKNHVLQLRYLGVMPHSGYREYSFHIEHEDKSTQQVALTIDDAHFRENRLMFQEAPDLCHQKLLAELGGEKAAASISSRRSVTDTDINSYRHSHPAAKLRRGPTSRRAE